jgi:sec-independent protein translocase protein TatB
MFDNPEKLFLILVIALMIFGPSKLAGLGGTLGRAMRDFRSAVRGAQDDFSSTLREARETVRDAHETLISSERTDTTSPPEIPLALPGPDTAAPSVSLSEATAVSSAEPATAAVGTAAETLASPPGAPSDDFEGPYSLVSEPSAQAVRESARRRD